MRGIGNWITRSILGERRYGALTYRRYPALGRAWGGPMNGQAWRCRLVAELVLKLDPAAIVETGAYRGTTTEWLSAFQLPVYTCEASEENYGFSRSRLGAIPNVHLLCKDSRTALREILGGPLSNVADRQILFYLDAHWNDDLPLADEMDIIFSVTSRAAVLVDDFQVPDDPGYGYDDYGQGKALTQQYIADSARRHGLAAFYPTTSSTRETGAKRGCVLLVREQTLGALVGGVSLLRRLPHPVAP
jgi:hypothetical protein